MKIKKLTIQGFKSFVDKTTLNFSSGTSAIIGPNGCGKSNVVDAIRWVLGEQNPRHLRGKLMEDIIFGGSSSRKPTGMAEVVLTFSNEDGLAPARYANFTEIEVARRLYRSGESEYYINKVQSRLKDIVDLFTDTGIGTRAYSIVEQGQVGWLVTAKPEERRAIFEEAAGINKFKHKKAAALRRLEATKENLTRVNDIISEVKRQLRSLDRQAKKAERYKRLKEELKEVELTLGSIELDGMKARYRDLEKRLQEVRDQELASENSISAREGKTEELKAEYLREENDFKAVKERVVELERAIQAEERSSALVKMRIEELERNETRLTGEIEELRASEATGTREIEDLKGALEDLSGSLSERTERLEERAAALREHSDALKEKEEAQRAEKTEALDTSTRLTDIKHTIQSLLKEEENLREREAKARSTGEELSRKLEEKRGPVAGLTRDIEEAAGRKDSIEGNLASVRDTLAALEEKRTTLEAERDSLKDEHAALAARLATLEEMERNLENLDSGARTIMKREDTSGVHGILADLIEANPGFEKAVEAALGDRINYVIVESQKEGLDAVEYLKGCAGGKGSFVPVRGIRSASPVPASASPAPGGSRPLLGEVRVKEGYEQVVENLLGDVLLVDDLDSGVELWQRNGFYGTLVTPEGEIIDPQGIITGGRTDGKDEGILHKRNEIKRLRARVGEIEERLTAVAETLRETSDRITGSKASVEELREKLHAAELEKLNLEGELKRLTEESERLAEQSSATERDMREAAERLTEISGKKAELSRERGELEGKLGECEKRSEDLASEIEDAAAVKERLAEEVTELKVELAQARERYESLKGHLSARESTLGETAGKINSKTEEIERGRQERAEKLEEVEELGERIEELLAQVDSVKKEEVEKTEKLDAFSERLNTLERELKELKENASDAVELKGELTVELRELDLKINHLKEKVIEKYGADLDAVERPEDEEPDTDELKKSREELESKISSLGTVSLSALEEYAELEERHEFLLNQQADLNESVESLHKAITRINRTTRERFRASFDEINAKFKESFPRFFNGGKAELRLSDERDILESGVEIVAQPPGKRLQNITLLSGGERALTATSLIFSIFLTKPSPFCLLDEVDAPLDDANIDRFNSFVKEMSKISQFMMITHNKKTMEIADTLYGVTMEDPGVSKILTLDLPEAQSA